MTILAFWTADNETVDRHTLDNVLSDLDAFGILWHKRDELKARFYHMDTSSYSNPFGQYGILNASDFEKDYNDKILDGRKWTCIIRLDEEYVEQIINE